MMIYIKTYGIACIEEKDGNFEITKQIDGITTDQDVANRLVSLFNEHHLSPEHFEDVVEDMLTII